ncbi:MAG: hypothetical protein AAF228_03055 [Pseudomonadota bacterium]
MSNINTLNPQFIIGEEASNLKKLLDDKEEWLNTLEGVYGDGIDQEKADTIREAYTDFLEGKLSSDQIDAPGYAWLSNDAMLGAEGAYYNEDGQDIIFLNQDLLDGAENYESASEAARMKISAVLAEEFIGHHTEHALDRADTPGDEGAKFLYALTGDENAKERSQLDDSSYVYFNNEYIEVENYQDISDISLIPTTSLKDAIFGDREEYFSIYDLGSERSYSTQFPTDSVIRSENGTFYTGIVKFGEQSYKIVTLNSITNEFWITPLAYQDFQNGGYVEFVEETGQFFAMSGSPSWESVQLRLANNGDFIVETLSDLFVTENPSEKWNSKDFPVDADKNLDFLLGDSILKDTGSPHSLTFGEFLAESQHLQTDENTYARLRKIGDKQHLMVYNQINNAFKLIDITSEEYADFITVDTSNPDNAILSLKNDDFFFRLTDSESVEIETTSELLETFFGANSIAAPGEVNTFQFIDNFVYSSQDNIDDLQSDKILFNDNFYVGAVEINGQWITAAIDTKTKRIIEINLGPYLIQDTTDGNISINIDQLEVDGLLSDNDSISLIIDNDQNLVLQKTFIDNDRTVTEALWTLDLTTEPAMTADDLFGISNNERTVHQPIPRILKPGETLWQGTYLQNNDLYGGLVTIGSDVTQTPRFLTINDSTGYVNVTNLASDEYNAFVNYDAITSTVSMNDGYQLKLSSSSRNFFFEKYVTAADIFLADKISLNDNAASVLDTQSYLESQNGVYFSSIYQTENGEAYAIILHTQTQQYMAYNLSSLNGIKHLSVNENSGLLEVTDSDYSLLLTNSGQLLVADARSSGSTALVNFSDHMSNESLAATSMFVQNMDPGISAYSLKSIIEEDKVSPTDSDNTALYPAMVLAKMAISEPEAATAIMARMTPKNAAFVLIEMIVNNGYGEHINTAISIMNTMDAASSAPILEDLAKINQDYAILILDALSPGKIADIYLEMDAEKRWTLFSNFTTNNSYIPPDGSTIQIPSNVPPLPNIDTYTDPYVLQRPDGTWLEGVGAVIGEDTIDERLVFIADIQNSLGNFLEIGNRFVAPVQINGKLSYRFVDDTGKFIEGAIAVPPEQSNQSWIAIAVERTEISDYSNSMMDLATSAPGMIGKLEPGQTLDEFSETQAAEENYYSPISNSGGNSEFNIAVGNSVDGDDLSAPNLGPDIRSWTSSIYNTNGRLLSVQDDSEIERMIYALEQKLSHGKTPNISPEDKAIIIKYLLDSKKNVPSEEVFKFLATKNHSEGNSDGLSATRATQNWLDHATRWIRKQFAVVKLPEKDNWSVKDELKRWIELDFIEKQNLLKDMILPIMIEAFVDEEYQKQLNQIQPSPNTINLENIKLVFTDDYNSTNISAKYRPETHTIAFSNKLLQNKESSIESVAILLHEMVHAKQKEISQRLFASDELSLPPLESEHAWYMSAYLVKISKQLQQSFPELIRGLPPEVLWHESVAYKTAYDMENYLRHRL